MRRVETTIPAVEYDALDREAGRRGCSISALVRGYVRQGMGNSLEYRVEAIMVGDNPYRLPVPPPQPVIDTGAW